MEKAIARKERSIALLKAQEVPYIEHLPTIEDEDSGEVAPRPAEQIARRAICTLLSIQHVFDQIEGTPEEIADSRGFFLEMLKAYGAENALTPMERAVFDGSLPREDYPQITWRYECYWVLVWALGLVEELDFPAEICDCERAIRLVADCADFDAFIKKVKLRPFAEILDAADLIFRYDWACVDARIHGRPAPAGLNPEVVVERHKALNWLISYGDDWDDLPHNT